MNKLERVKNELSKLDYTDIKIISNTIEFKYNKINYEIYDVDISIDENDRIAWFQAGEDDDFKIKIIENNELFEWTPVTHNSVFGCTAYLVEWIKNHLIFIYREKHEIYICSIKDKKVNYFNFHGEEIERKDNLISYETYLNSYSKKGLVRLLQIPELIQIEPISIEKAKQENLIPLGLNRPDGFLNKL